MATHTAPHTLRCAEINLKLAQCKAAGIIDRFLVSDQSVLIIQGRYAHKIPVSRACTFITGLLQYADAAGFDSSKQAA